jgi:carbohydrate-binding DOMON domain-containing protein
MSADARTRSYAMSKIRVNGFSISIDGYGAGPDQSLANPLGVGGEALHEWIVGTISSPVSIV